MSSQSVSAKEIQILLELSLVYGRCCPVVQTDARWSAENLLDTDGRPDTSLGRPDENKGSDFY